MARNRTRGADKRERPRKAATAAPRMPGLRWVPVPLAILLAAIGWLVFGSATGQHALAAAHEGPQAGGLALTISQVVWMVDDMSTPGQKVNPNQFQMPASMMPGMQTLGEKRLRVELYVRNVSSSPQRYALGEFRLFGTGGKSWSPVANAATRGQILSAALDPGFQAIIDLYFDLPLSQGNRLTMQWEHGGTTVTFPIHATGMSSGSMVGM